MNVDQVMHNDPPDPTADDGKTTRDAFLVALSRSISHKKGATAPDWMQFTLRRPFRRLRPDMLSISGQVSEPRVFAQPHG